MYSGQIPLLLSMQEEELALQKAVNSEDTDLMYLTLIHVERSRADYVSNLSTLQFLRLFDSQLPSNLLATDLMLCYNFTFRILYHLIGLSLPVLFFS